MSDPKQITYKSTRKRRNRTLFLVLAIAALLGCIWFMYWYFHGRFYMYTNDAYVGGNLVVVTPRIFLSLPMIPIMWNKGEFLLS